jgi:hypothetical protein
VNPSTCNEHLEALKVNLDAEREALERANALLLKCAERLDYLLAELLRAEHLSVHLKECPRCAGTGTYWHVGDFYWKECLGGDEKVFIEPYLAKCDHHWHKEEARLVEIFANLGIQRREISTPGKVTQ